MKFETPSPPRTIMEVFRMLPEGTLAELINGQLYMSPTPTPLHQRAVKKLLIALDQFVEKNDLGEIFMSPCDIYLDQEANAVQPDLFFIAKDNLRIKVSEDGPIKGVPDIVIEILSPGNNKHDLITKKNLYENFGVKEYWIVDPKTKEATVYILQNKVFKLLEKQTGKIFSELFNAEFEF